MSPQRDADGGESVDLDRRSYLEGCGAAALGGLALDRSTLATDYDRVVNIVEAGADPTGQEPIDEVFNRLEQDGTRIEFPDGRYLIDQLNLYGRQNFAMVATGDATLVPNRQNPGGIHETFWIAGWNMTDFTFEGFTIDSQATGIHPTITFGAHDGLLVKDVDKIGLHDGDNQAFGFAVLSESGQGRIENLRATDGSIRYAKTTATNGGAVGVYVKGAGTLTLDNCHLREWGDNGLYASDATGPVQVEGGTYKDNEVASVRLGSPGSYVRDATIAVETPDPESRNARGVWVYNGPQDPDEHVLVDNCDIMMLNGRGNGGIVNAYTGGSMTVQNTRIYVTDEYVDSGGNSRAVFVDEPSGIGFHGSRLFQNVSIAGPATGGRAVLVDDRNNNAFHNVSVHHLDGVRTGLSFLGGENHRVEHSNVNVLGNAVEEQNTSVSVTDVVYGGTAEVPPGFDLTDPYGNFSFEDAPITQAPEASEYPLAGLSRYKPTLPLFGNLLDPRTREFLLQDFPPFANELLMTGYFDLGMRMIPYDPSNTQDTTGWGLMAKIGLGVWDLEPHNYWPYVKYVAQNPPSGESLDYETARDLLQNAGLQYYGWIPARALEGYYDDLLQQTVSLARSSNLTTTAQMRYQGQTLNALSDYLIQYFENRL